LIAGSNVGLITGSITSFIGGFIVRCYEDRNVYIPVEASAGPESMWSASRALSTMLPRSEPHFSPSRESGRLQAWTHEIFSGSLLQAHFSTPIGPMEDRLVGGALGALVDFGSIGALECWWSIGALVERWGVGAGWSIGALMER
jgi:hypothetical protein